MKSRVANIYEKLKRGKIKVSKVERGETRHLLAEGDCLDVMRFIPDRSIDLIITDPPYNQSLDYGKSFDDNKSTGEYYSWLKRRLEDIPRILNKSGSFYLISYPEIAARLLPFLEDELKLNYRRWITWHYPTNIGHSKKNFTRSQRTILFFTKEKDGYVFNRDAILQPYKNPTAPVIKERLKMGSRGRVAYDMLRLADLYEINKLSADVQEFDLLKNNSPERLRNLKYGFTSLDNNKKKLQRIDHPCQLPLSLLEILVNVSSKKGSIVLDPFAGTFTTSMAAARLGRSSIGTEMNRRFIGFGLKRLKT